MRNLTASLYLTIAVLIGSAGMSWGATGIVVLNKSGCSSRYVVETNKGYVILEWFGGNDPKEGNKMVGDFESYGMKTIHNVSVDSETRVWVEDFWLSRSSVIEKLREFCN